MILSSNFFNQPHEIVFRSILYLFKKVGNKYYSPRGKSVDMLLTKFGSGEIKKINISGCILEKINNSFKIYREKWKKGQFCNNLALVKIIIILTLTIWI